MTKKPAIGSSEKSQVYFVDLASRSNTSLRAKRGALISFSAQIVNTAMLFGSTAILARLLTPADFGLVAMVAFAVRFATDFRDAGLSMAIVQRQTISAEQVSTIFWIVVAFSAFLSLLLVALSPFFAAFYNEPRLGNITRFLAIPIFVGGISIQHVALQNRNLEFDKIAFAQTLARFLSIVVGIAVAYWTRSYWALVSMPICFGLCLAIFAWMACPWRPSLPRRNTRVGSMLVFGGNLTGFKLANSLIQQFDNVLLGRFAGASEVGLYSRSYGLMAIPTMFLPPMERVAVPILSGLVDNQEKHAQAYFRMANAVQLCLTPICAFIGGNASMCITLALGPEWTAASTILGFLSVVGLVRCFTGTCQWLLISQGQAQDLLRLGGVDSLLILLSFAFSVRWGGLGLSVAYAGVMLLVHLPLYYYWIGRRSSVNAFRLWRSTARRVPMLLGVGAIGIMANRLESFSLSSRLLISSISSLCFWSTYVVFSKHDLTCLIQLANALMRRSSSLDAVE